MLRRLYERKGKKTEPIRGIIQEEEFCLLKFGPETANIDTSKIFMISPHFVIIMMAFYLKDFKFKWIRILSKPIYNLSFHFFYVFGPDEEEFIQTM